MIEYHRAEKFIDEKLCDSSVRAIVAIKLKSWLFNIAEAEILTCMPETEQYND